MLTHNQTKDARFRGVINRAKETIFNPLLAFNNESIETRRRILIEVYAFN